MASETLKAKVLFGWGLLAAVFTGLYAPEALRALAPFAFCVVLAAALLFASDLIEAMKKAVSNRPKRVTSQAVKTTNSHATWCDHIDYENYLIPTYLRQHGGEL